MEGLKDHVTRNYIIKKLQIWINKEVKCLCSDEVNSFLRNSEVSGFAWDAIVRQLKHHAPLFLAFMQACLYTKKPRKNYSAVLGMCTAIILKHRCREMSLVQKILSLVLYAGNAGKQVIIFIYLICVTVLHFEFLL